MDKKSTIFSWKNVVLTASAFAAYHIGAGFASGQEVLQFFGSWGGIWPLVLPIIALLINAVYSASGYITGTTMQFDNPYKAYEYYGGKTFAKFMDVFSIVMIAGMGLSMFAGCGATMKQYLGIPVYVGAVILGIAAVIVIWFGLERVTQVLGVVGIVIIVTVLLICIYSLATNDRGFFEAQKNIPAYVAEGKILQASVAGIKNPILAGLFYGGVQVLTCFHFVIGNGANLNGKKEGVASGILSAALFVGGLYLVNCAVITNIDYIVAKEAEVPMLAVVEKILPVLEPFFAIIIVCGIFTTITGYLWTIGRRFAPDKTAKQRIVIIVVALCGIFGGSIVPFSTLVNFFTPLVGLVGIISFLFMAVHEIKAISVRKNSGGK